MFVNVVGHCGNDVFFFSLTMHLCGQFEVLKTKLSEIEIEKSDYRKKIGSLVQRHCRLVLLADDLERSFNVVILVQLLMSILLLCIEGKSTRVSNKTSDFLSASQTRQLALWRPTIPTIASRYSVDLRRCIACRFLRIVFPRD